MKLKSYVDCSEAIQLPTLICNYSHKFTFPATECLKDKDNKDNYVSAVLAVLLFIRDILSTLCDHLEDSEST